MDAQWSWSEQETDPEKGEVEVQKECDVCGSLCVKTRVTWMLHLQNEHLYIIKITVQTIHEVKCYKHYRSHIVKPYISQQRD